MTPTGMYADGDGRLRPLTGPGRLVRVLRRVRRVARLALLAPTALLWVYPVWVFALLMFWSVEGWVWTPYMAAVAAVAAIAEYTILVQGWLRRTTVTRGARRARFARLSLAVGVFADAAVLVVLAFFWLVTPQQTAPFLLPLVAVFVVGLLIDKSAWRKVRR